MPGRVLTYINNSSALSGTKHKENIQWMVESCGTVTLIHICREESRGAVRLSNLIHWIINHVSRK